MFRQDLRDIQDFYQEGPSQLPAFLINLLVPPIPTYEFLILHFFPQTPALPPR